MKSEEFSVTQLFSYSIFDIMKTKILNYVWLLVMAVGFTACPKSDPEPAKNNACDIVSFKAGGETWQISGSSISFIYPKGTTENSMVPVITISPKATVDPPSGTAQNFFTAAGVTYTVTAEDGKATKTYIAKATVATK